MCQNESGATCKCRIRLNALRNEIDWEKIRGRQASGNLGKIVSADFRFYYPSVFSFMGLQNHWRAWN